MTTEPPSNENIYLLDAESGAEMARLMNQDRLVTRIMGGIIPEPLDLSNMHDVLDLGCGPGGWVFDVAYTYPKVNVVGIDISRKVVEYARAQAWTQGLNNASFVMGNILQPLNFPDNSFDLVNARFIAGFVPRTGWAKLLQECFRITRPGGIIRLTEPEMNFGTTPAFVKMAEIGTQAIKLAGLGFSLDGHQINITPMLSRLLRDAGFQDVKRKAHVIDFSAGEEAHHGFYQNYMIAAQIARPFLLKMKVATEEELDELYREMMIEMMQDNFQALWFLLTGWGEKPQL
jgi:ubiquinone/menaquinone biosynthesis C-methylase UbiE